MLRIGKNRVAALCIPRDSNFIACERFGEWGAQDRQQYPVLQRGIGRLPIDVEGARMSALPAVFENVHPPGVFASHRHVIGNDIDNQTHPVCLERRDQFAERILAAEFVIDARMIHHIITMRGAASRGENRRSVDMTDAEPREIGNDRASVLEGEFLTELETICGAGDHPAFLAVVNASMRTRFASSRSRSLSFMRLRQLGCSSSVPGKFG